MAENKHEEMTALAESFHVLRGRPGVRPWAQLKFAKGMSGGQSTSEKYAAAFVLSVWNGGTFDNPWWCEGEYRVGKFDPVDAMARWDSEMRDAFIAWCENPFWP